MISRKLFNIVGGLVLILSAQLGQAGEKVPEESILCRYNQKTLSVLHINSGIHGPNEWGSKPNPEHGLYMFYHRKTGEPVYKEKSAAFTKNDEGCVDYSVSFNHPTRPTLELTHKYQSLCPTSDANTLSGRFTETFNDPEDPGFPGSTSYLVKCKKVTWDNL